MIFRFKDNCWNYYLPARKSAWMEVKNVYATVSFMDPDDGGITYYSVWLIEKAYYTVVCPD